MIASERAPRAWRAFALALAGALGAGCGDASSGASDPSVLTPSTTALRFDRDGVVRINPGSRFVLSLLSPGAEAARVWLDGAYLDASVNRGIVDLTSGQARLTLTAPTSATTFTVRARQGAATTRLAVTVTPEGMATLQVSPTYDGPRPVPSFVASVYVGRSCASLTDGALPDDDGSPRAEAPKGAPLILPQVPAGEALAVLVRARHYAAGCVDLGPLEVDSAHALEVTLYRRELDMTSAFDATLSFELTSDERAAYASALSGAATHWVDHFLPVGTTEAVWLLDAMAASAGEVSAAAANELTSKRAAGSWNAKATTWLAARPPTMRARAAALATAGIASPPSPLTFSISPPVGGVGRVTPRTLAGAPIDGDWLSAAAPFEWSGDAADVLRLEGVFGLRGGALIGFAADAAASPSPGVAAALAQAVDCAGLADALVGAGTSYAGCDRTCTAALCASGLVSRVRTATALTDQDGDRPTLGIIASASATLGDRAEITAFDGSAPSTFTAAAGATPIGLRAKLNGAPRP